jgi:hypothetical protein
LLTHVLINHLLNSIMRRNDFLPLPWKYFFTKFLKKGKKAGKTQGFRADISEPEKR